MRVGHPALGPLAETFVLSELMKLRAASETPFSFWQFRGKDGIEIDFVLVGPGGAVIGIQVEASTSPGSSSVRHLRWIRQQLGDRFAAGIVLHLGERATSFGDGVLALPMSAPWNHARVPSGH